MRTQKKVRWDILGAGLIAHTFCKDIKHAQYAELTAITSRTKHTARHFADTYKITEALEGYQDLYQHPSIDVIYIAMPHSFHF
jgi:predicted dehydrogenase